LRAKADHRQRSGNEQGQRKEKETDPSFAHQGSDICATHNTFDGLNGVTFQPVIDVDIRGDVAFPRTVDEVTESLARRRVFFSDLSVQCENFDGVRIRATGTQKRSRGSKWGGECLVDEELLAQARHSGPSSEDVRHVVRLQHIEIGRIKEVVIADLNGIL